MLSAAAFNAFLKTLEEPPSYAIFILATTEKHKILPTILSRCQIFDFKRITTEHIVGHLQSIASKEAMIAEEAALHVIAQKSEGCMRDALSMLDRIASFTNGHLNYALTMEHLNMLDADFYFRLTDHLLSQDVSGSLLLLDEVLERGFEGNVIIDGLAEHFRNLLLCRDKRMARLLDVPNDHKPVYLEKANQTPPSYILSALNVLNESELNFRNAINKRLHVEMCFIRLCYLLQATNAEDLKKNFSSEIISVAAIDNKQPIPPVSYQPQNEIAQQVEESKPVAPKTVSQPSPTPSIPNTARRISKHLLEDLEQEIQTSIQENQHKQFKLDEAIVLPLFEAYKEQLKSDKQSYVFNIFSVLKIELPEDDEIKLVAPNELSESTVKEQRNKLIDYFSQKVGFKVRVTTEVRIDPELEKQLPKLLSKQEIFDKLSQKNPALKQLKDRLNLQIDF
jgi:DNA polymerase-3 subunit gamma/tau